MSTLKRIDRTQLAALGGFSASEIANATWMTRAADGTVRLHSWWMDARDRRRQHGDEAFRVEDDRRPSWMRAVEDARPAVTNEGGGIWAVMAHGRETVRLKKRGAR
jgi:hypothetical protein